MKVSLYAYSIASPHFCGFFIYRYYVGTQPKIVIVDANLLKEIMVKEFDTFSTRGHMVKYPHCMELALLC